MNPVAEEMRAILAESENDLAHYGMPRRSGRYPWGSGDNPYQNNIDFLGRVDALRKEGFTFTDEKGKVWTGDTAIAKSMGLTSSQFRTEIALVNNEQRMYYVAKAKSLQKDGLGATAIGKEMGVSESTVRSWLDAESEARMMKAKETADIIRKNVDEKGAIDVGVGVERELRISKEKLNEALYILEREGYEVKGGRVEQATNKGKMTTIKAIFPPGSPKNALFVAMEKGEIHTLKEYISRDDGESFEKKFTYPSSMDSKRLMVRYAEDGGKEKDGIVELRRGVDDLSLGESRYSQVRILVDGNKYIKGMAVYADDADLPKGVDVVFNTNKTKDVAKMHVLKDITKDPDNPFGSAIKDSEQGGQYWYTDSKTGERKLGLINKRADEGDWDDWVDALPSQFLAKQSQQMAEKQLRLAVEDKVAEFRETAALENPTVKKHLLTKFADECDSAAIHLKAAALPGQKYHVIIPINSLKDTEVYAPKYENGTQLALIRYPHGGTFEIPILTVNNKHAAAKKLLGKDVKDAIGINSKVAERLSGADFDGDTVMCIPTHDAYGKVKIRSRDNLEDLEGFDPKTEYGYDSLKVDSNGDKHYYRNGVEFRVMKNTQTEMGKISNLITDMTLLGASDKELAAAVKHSMVVIDAEKHKLDYKQSEVDNNISALKKNWQVHVSEDGKVTYGGAATLISKAKGRATVPKRQGNPITNTKLKANGKPNPDYDPSKPEGSLIWKTADDLYYPVRKYDKESGEITITTSDKKKVTYNVSDKEASDYYNPIRKVDPDTGLVTFTNKDGSISYEMATRTQRSTKMAETYDARTLISEADTPMERAYADYANKMKSLANEARKEVMATGKIEYDSSAKDKYRNEVVSLNEKLNIALLNAPRERQAQLKAYAEVTAKTKANEISKTDEIKKASQRALSKSRQEVGSVKRSEREIEITDKEWEAIQAGAVSENTLKKILNNASIDVLREKATPRTTTELSQVKINTILRMSNSDYTISEIANRLGISSSTVTNYLKGASK